VPITFLNPGLLLGLMAAAIPLAIHLWRRRRARRVEFSDLRFLAEVQVRQSRSLGLRRTLLLIIRMLILILLALAAARPRVSGLAPGGGGAVSMVMLIDGSASMQTQYAGGDRFDSARDLAAAMAAGLPADSEVQVITAADSPLPLFSGWTPAAADLAPALAAAAAADGNSDLPEALREAARWAESARNRPAQVVLFSDLQNSPPDSLDLADAAAAIAAAGCGRILLRRVGEEAANGGVLSVDLPVRALGAGEQISVGALTMSARDGQPWVLELDDTRVAETTAVASAGSAERIAFALTVPEPGFHKGIVRGVSDRLAVDDVQPFVIEVRDRIDVLIAHGPDRGVSGRGGWRYLAAALDPVAGTRDSVGDLFSVRPMAVSDLQAGDLTGVDVLICVDPGKLGRRLLEGLVDWLRGGGRMALFAGESAGADYLSTTLLPALDLPGSLVPRNRSEAGAEALELPGVDHPLLRGWPEDALSTIAEARWRRFLGVTNPGPAPVPLAFSGGDPALIEIGIGAGVCAFLPFHLDPADGDLAFNPMFPPLARRLASWLAAGGAGSATANVTVGDPLALRLPLDLPRGWLDGAPAVLFSATGNDAGRRLPARIEWRRGNPWLVADPARRRGFYAFVVNGDTLGLVAAAAPAAETSSRMLDTKGFAAYLQAAGMAEPSDLGKTEPEGLAAVLAGRELAPWLFGLAVLLMLAEIALGRGVGEAGAVP